MKKLSAFFVLCLLSSCSDSGSDSSGPFRATLPEIPLPTPRVGDGFDFKKESLERLYRLAPGDVVINDLAATDRLGEVLKRYSFSCKKSADPKECPSPAIGVLVSHGDERSRKMELAEIFYVNVNTCLVTLVSSNLLLTERFCAERFKPNQQNAGVLFANGSKALVTEVFFAKENSTSKSANSLALVRVKGKILPNETLEISATAIESGTKYQSYRVGHLGDDFDKSLILEPIFIRSAEFGVWFDPAANYEEHSTRLIKDWAAAGAPLLDKDGRVAAVLGGRKQFFSYPSVKEHSDKWINTSIFEDLSDASNGATPTNHIAFNFDTPSIDGSEKGMEKHHFDRLAVNLTNTLHAGFQNILNAELATFSKGWDYKGLRYGIRHIVFPIERGREIFLGPECVIKAERKEVSYDKINIRVLVLNWDYYKLLNEHEVKFTPESDEYQVNLRWEGDSLQFKHPTHPTEYSSNQDPYWINIPWCS